MKTLKNRVLSGAMAGVLAMSLAVPAFAADNQTIITGSYEAVDIAVTVPRTGTALINPYGLDVQVAEDPLDNTNTNKVTISGQQVVSAPMSIKNESAMDLSVSATVTGEVATGSDLRFALGSTNGSGTEGSDDYVAPATTKSVFAYLEAAPEASLTGLSTSVNAAAIATAYAAWAPSTYDASKHIIVGTRGVTQDLVTLRAATLGGTAAAPTVTYNAGSIALLRLTGDCVASPRGAAWADTDGFTATIAYTFSPAQLTKYTVTVNTPTATGAGVNPATVAAVPDTVAGDTVTLNITADNQSDIVTVTVKNGTETVATGAASNGGSGTAFTYSFTMPAANVTVDVVSSDT